MANILVLHGPNMALKGVTDIDRALEARANALEVELSIFQSNAESALVDHLFEQQHEVDGLIVNPGVLAPTAWVLAEALELIKKPSVEVLLSTLAESRGPSALAGLVAQQIHGKGRDGYLLALEAVTKLVPASADGEASVRREPQGNDDDGDDDESDAPSAPRGKTIGRRQSAAETGPQLTEKTIGRRTPGEAKPVAAAPKPSGLLTRALVKEKLKARLAGTLSAEALASWARTEWSALQNQGPCEEGRRHMLDGVLLTLMAGAKVSDDILLAQLAKLES